MAKKRYDADKALFDLDESIDHLSLVSDRYQQPPPQPSHTDGGANEEQGKGKQEMGGDYDDERHGQSPQIGSKGTRLQLQNGQKKNMTPTPKQVTIGPPDKAAKSRISEAELKQEMIKDLTAKKGGSGRNSRLVRNGSSKLSNHNERRASAKVLQMFAASS